VRERRAVGGRGRRDVGYPWRAREAHAAQELVRRRARPGRRGGGAGRGACDAANVAWRARRVIGAGGGRTDGGDDEDDEEGVGHGDEGVGDGGEDLGDGLELAEDAEDAAAADEQHQAEGDADRGEADEGEDDDEEVEEAPAVGEEGAPPVGEEVERQLGGEGDDEEEVDLAQVGDPVVVRVVGADLRLADADGKVLRAGKESGSSHSARINGFKGPVSWVGVIKKRTAIMKTAERA
jgi:hypothetical protein